jgi:hypothetical protein
METGFAIHIPAIDNFEEYEFLPGHFAIDRVLEVNSTDGGSTYTVKLQSGERETVSNAMLNPRRLLIAHASHRCHTRSYQTWTTDCSRWTSSRNDQSPMRNQTRVTMKFKSLEHVVSHDMRFYSPTAQRLRMDPKFNRRDLLALGVYRAAQPQADTLSSMTLWTLKIQTAMMLNPRMVCAG